MPKVNAPGARRKHRLVVELTTSHALTESDATKGLQLLLDDRLDLQRAPIWASNPAVYGEKVTVKRFSRVMQAEVNSRRGRRR